jgi:hypothetical protein
VGKRCRGGLEHRWALDWVAENTDDAASSATVRLAARLSKYSGCGNQVRRLDNNSWIVVGVVSFLDAKAASMNPSEAQNPRDNQKNRYNVIEQLRYNQNQDAGDQRDDRLKVCDAYGHFLIPYVGCVITLDASPPPPGCSRPRRK